MINYMGNKASTPAAVEKEILKEVEEVKDAREERLKQLAEMKEKIREERRRAFEEIEAKDEKFAVRKAAKDVIKKKTDDSIQEIDEEIARIKKEKKDEKDAIAAARTAASKQRAIQSEVKRRLRQERYEQLVFLLNRVAKRLAKRNTYTTVYRLFKDNPEAYPPAEVINHYEQAIKLEQGRLSGLFNLYASSSYKAGKSLALPEKFIKYVPEFYPTYTVPEKFKDYGAEYTHSAIVKVLISKRNMLAEGKNDPEEPKGDTEADTELVQKPEGEGEGEDEGEDEGEAEGEAEVKPSALETRNEGSNNTRDLAEKMAGGGRTRRGAKRPRRGTKRRA